MIKRWNTLIYWLQDKLTERTFREQCVDLLPNYLYEYGIEGGNPKPIATLTPKEMFDLIKASAKYD